MTRDWQSPTLYEVGATVADARRLLRQAAETWITIQSGDDDFANLKIAKAAILHGLKFRAADEPMHARLYVTPATLADCAYLGRSYR